MSEPVTVRNDSGAQVVFRDRAGVRQVIDNEARADVHRDDLEYLRSLGVVQDRSGKAKTEKDDDADKAPAAPRSLALASRAPADDQAKPSQGTSDAHGGS